MSLHNCLNAQVPKHRFVTRSLSCSMRREVWVKKEAQGAGWEEVGGWWVAGEEREGEGWGQRRGKGGGSRHSGEGRLSSLSNVSHKNEGRRALSSSVSKTERDSS